MACPPDAAVSAPPLHQHTGALLGLRVGVSVLQGGPYRRIAPEVSAAAQEALGVSIPWPRLPQAQELLEVLADHLLLAVEGQESPQQALDATQERWLEILGKRGN